MKDCKFKNECPTFKRKKGTCGFLEGEDVEECNFYQNSIELEATLNGDY